MKISGKGRILSRFLLEKINKVDMKIVKKAMPAIKLLLVLSLKKSLRSKF